MSGVLADFAADIGDVAPITVAGGGTKGDLGGCLDADVTVVRAPSGISQMRPKELVVTVGAGTPLAELDQALESIGQQVALDGPVGATVGGQVASGQGGVHARGLGPLRDAVLGISAVDAWGRVVRAGGGTVKNVSGFDLCRLWTGSLGTLALFGEITLRTGPRWENARWAKGEADPFEVDRIAPDATSILWNGRTVWVHLVGHHSDVARVSRTLAQAGCDSAVAGPPTLPPFRQSIDPAALAALTTPGASESAPDHAWIAELGVGVLHTMARPDPVDVPRRLWELHRSVKDRFDPQGRFNPGRSPLNGVVSS